MESFAIYLFRSVIWLTGFALVYLLFLRNERFFLLKRIYLLTGILVSLICPLFTIHYQVEVAAPVIGTTGLFPAEISSVPATPSTAEAETFDYRKLLLFLYLAGVIVLVSRLVWHMLLMGSAIRRSTIMENGKARLVRVAGFRSSFSFFNYVFISPSTGDNEVREIVNHELVHINQKHWLDLILTEVLRILQWMNPFAWIYTGFIRVNHEYMADEGALKSTSDPAFYRAALINQLFRSPVISLSNSFNYSLNKRRFDMMKKIIKSPYRKLKVFLVLPVVAGILYAFAAPEYNYVSQAREDATFTIYESEPIVQKEVRGIVFTEDGKPLEGVYVTSTGSTTGYASMAQTGSDGSFIIENVHPDASLLFFCRGYKRITLKPDFNGEMKVILEIDPEYKGPSQAEANSLQTRKEPLVVLDGVITDKNRNDLRRELGHNFGQEKFLSGNQATEKYGEKGRNGVYEVMTRKKAIEMGIKTPFPRLTPDDYPTFQGKSYDQISNWIIAVAEYPAEAKSQNLEGYVTVNFTVELDGTISNINSSPSSNPVLADEIIRILKALPNWDSPKNPDVDEPFTTNVTVQFKLPNQIEPCQLPFVVVEEMPMYPGGEEELLMFIANNMHYPDSARAQGIEGRVIVRFFVSTDGNAEAASVIRGVHPLLDAEAIRVVSLMKGFKPGMQDGHPVNVWYMVPITFGLNPATKE
jgi:TonB family protein